MDDNVAAAAAVYAVDDSAAVAVEVTRGSRRRQEIVDGGAGIASGLLRVGGTSGGYEWIGDSQCVPVCLDEVAAFDVFLEIETLDERL